MGGVGGLKTTRFVTVGGPVGLILGILLGALAHNGSAPWLSQALPLVEPVGRLWMNALRLAVVPLTFCLLAVGVCTLPKGSDLGKWGLRTLLWFVGLLVAAALFSLLVTQLYLDAANVATVPIPQLGPSAVAAETQNWVDQLLPTNAFAAAAKGDVLPIAVLAVLFGFALRALPQERRKPVQDLLAGVRDAVLVFVHWVVWFIPFGAFALMFSFSAGSGLATAGVLLHYTLYVSVMLAVLIAALVLGVMFAARRPVREVFSALSPLFAVSVGTRSSLASLPTLVESAQEFGLPAPASEVVLPTAVSVFKLNRTATGVSKLLFMAAVCGIVVPPQALAVYMGTVVLLSFATPGLPGGGSNVSWGAYMAAGMPMEAIVLFDMTDGLTDFAKTATNVIADFAVAVFVSRGLTGTRTDLSPTLATASEEPAG